MLRHGANFAGHRNLKKRKCKCKKLQFIGQTVFVNVYMPSSSTYCCEDEYVDCLASIANVIMDLQYSDLVVGGDMNLSLIHI